MRSFFTIILTALNWFAAFSQVELNTLLSQDSILIGQPASYELTMLLENKSDSAYVDWLIPLDSLGEGLEIIEVKTKRNEDKNYSISKTIEFRSEKTGFYPIEPITVKVRNKSFNSQAKLVSVYSTLTNPAQEEIREIKEGNDVSYGVLDWLFDNWIWILIFLIIITVSTTILKRLAIQKKPEILPIELIEEPKEPAYDIALRKISVLSEKKPWQSSDLKGYHSSISYILREYLEGELDIQALEIPTSEILNECSKRRFSQKDISSLRQLLSLTDLVKFAKRLPTETENQGILLSIKHIVDSIHSQFSNQNS